MANKISTTANPVTAAADPFRVANGMQPQDDAMAANNYTHYARNAAGTLALPVIGVNSSDKVELAGEAIQPMLSPVSWQAGPTALIPAAQSFYTAPSACVIDSIVFSHGTAATDSGVVTCYVTKDTGTQAAGAGTTTMVGTFNCKATVNVPQTATLALNKFNGKPNDVLVLAAGDRLSVKLPNTNTTLANVAVTVYLRPGSMLPHAQYYCASVARMPASSATVFAQFNRPMRIVGGYARWGTKSSTATAIDLKLQSGTTAPGGGTSILSATVDATGTANTNNALALSATAANLLCPIGSRLSISLSSAATALANLQVVVFFAPLYGEVAFHWNCYDAATSAVTQTIWGPADRDYELVDCSASWSVLGTNPQITFAADRGTAVPGAGTAMLSATIDGGGTANTFNVGALATLRSTRIIAAGDRLSIITSGTKTSWVGLCASINLRPV